MSGLQARAEDHINGVDVREQGSALRVVTNTPHLVSLGTGRLSTAVTLHPIKQGRVTIGSDPTCDIYVVGTGVASVHSRVENSHGVVTLYPVSGSTLLDGLPVDKPTRLSQGSMLTIGRSNYLRFNHPEEAKLMKSVLPGAHISMAPIQFTPNEDCRPTGYQNHNMDPNDCYQNSNMQQKIYKDNTLKQLDQELDNSIKELGRKKPPVAPKKPFRDLEYSDSNSDQESQKPKMSSIMAKVSKFEYYAKTQQKSRSQFYTHENEISPKVFSSNSLTVNTPAVDVLGGKNTPTYLNSKENNLKLILSENNSVDPRKCSYANVAIRNRTKIDEIVRNFDENTQNKLPKKINNDQIRHDHIYGKINSDHRKPDNTSQECPKTYHRPSELCMESSRSEVYARIADKTGNIRVPCLPSPAFDRNPQYSPVYANSSQYDRSLEAENRRKQGAPNVPHNRVAGYTSPLVEVLHGGIYKAYKERVEEEEQKDAENARLEEILNMCAEYERQIATGTPNTPTEKKSQNKIITNGSLPRSVALNNPNFVQTSEGYYKFDTSHNRNNSSSRSLPLQRNLSSYENFDVTQISNSTDPNTPEVTISNQSYGDSGRMDEIGIPVFEGNKHELSSPIMIRRIQNNDKNSLSPIGSPYENVYNRGNLKPKSPNTQSPRTRIKTSFAHKNLPSPQYFIFPTPPPVDNSRKPNFVIPEENDKTADAIKVDENNKKNAEEKPKFEGIEKQLSLEEEIPMIDDASLADDIEFRYSKVLPESDDVKKEIQKNQSFDDVRKELMADIPELDDFEKDLQKNRDKVVKNITDDIKKMDADVASIESTLTIDVNINELRGKYDVLKEERRKLVAEIHEHKCKMSEIRSQEDDILRELEMEKALIKGEYDSEIAILNIEQKKKNDLLEQAKRLETEIRQLKDSQHTRQNEMHERVEIATTKVERIEKDVKQDVATMEELQNAKDILENESKMSEDLEFQHLEEESELLANREDIQNEIIVLSKKIESQKNRILTLKSEANNNLTSALDETKILQAEYVRLLNRVEDLTTKVQTIEKELKPLVAKLNDIERTQSPDSAFFTDQTRAKSGEFGYSPQSSDSDDLDLTKLTNFQDHSKQIKDKFNSIDQMSQSMIVDIERRDITELLDEVDPRSSESPSKSSTSSKEKKGFWERNFDSLGRRRSKDKKPKSPEKVDIMSQSLNENLFYNNENIETDNFDRYNSLRTSNRKKEKHPVQKSNSSSKIPTFAALTKIIKKDSFKKHNETDDSKKNRYVKNGKQINEHKYAKSKNSPEKITELPEDVKDDTPNQKGHNVTFDEVRSKSSDVDSTFSKVLHRKSCGDEPNMRCDFQKISDSGKIPSQDDIDRISKVTIDAPILGSDADMNSLGKKTYDSLMEIERKRLMMLEEQGCQVIENEREKISELKRRVQDETKKLWDQKYKNEQTKSFDSDTGQLSMEFDSSLGPNDSLRTNGVNERNGESSANDDPFNLTGSTIFEESSGLMSSSIEELQVRNSRTESNEDDKRSDDSRPLSHASDFSRDNILSLSNAPRRSRRAIAPYSESQRPLTRYLPVDRDDFDLRRHVESAGHQVDVCPHVIVTASCCRGYLHKLGAKFHTWSKRWFVFDRDTKTFVYYWDKSEKKPRGGAYFQVIEEVYLDHGNTSKSPNPQTTFIVKTRQRRYYLMAPSGEAARMWIDVIFTGAQGYTEYME